MNFKHIDTFRYENIKQVTNSDGKHFYVVDGNAYPSVTTVLGHFKNKELKKILEEWKARVGEEEVRKHTESSKARGTKLHNVFEDYLRNRLNTMGMFPDMKEAFQLTRPLLDRINNIRLIEAPLYSKRLKIAGMVDVIADFDGKLSVIDFKTATYVKNELEIENYFQQATAYALMYKECYDEDISQIVVIMYANDSPRPECFIKNPDHYQYGLCQKVKEYNDSINK